MRHEKWFLKGWLEYWRKHLAHLKFREYEEAEVSFRYQQTLRDLLKEIGLRD
jgi:hypothetical protein